MPGYLPCALRPHATTRINNYILNSKCLHVDAWWHWRPEGERLETLVLEIRACMGGHTGHVQRDCYLLEPDGNLAPLGDAAIGDDYQPVTINGMWARSHPVQARRLNDAHWAHVYPMLDAFRAKHKRTSFILHYVRAPSVDPCEGLDNQYDTSGRAERDRELAAREAEKTQRHAGAYSTGADTFVTRMEALRGLLD